MNYDLTKNYETLDDLLNAIDNYVKWNIEDEKTMLKDSLNRGINTPYVNYLKRKYPEIN